MLKKEFPAVELVLLDKNYGFAEGYNRSLLFKHINFQANKRLKILFVCFNKRKKKGTKLIAEVFYKYTGRFIQFEAVQGHFLW